MTTHHQQHGNYPSERAKPVTSKKWADFLTQAVEEQRRRDMRDGWMCPKAPHDATKKEGGK